MKCPRKMSKKPQNSLLPEELEKSSESVMPPSDDGRKRRKSKASSHLLEEDSIMSKIFSASFVLQLMTRLFLEDRSRFCMLVSLLRSREMIFKDKSISSKKNIQTLKLSQTSQVVSTGNVKASGSSWISRVPEVSNELSWRSVIDSADLPSSSSNMSSVSMAPSSKLSDLRNLLQNKNSKKTSSALSKCSAVEEMEKDDTKGRKKTKIPKNHVIATRIIKIRPTKSQKQQIDKIAGVVRFCYNASINEINKMRCHEISWPSGKLDQHLRNKFSIGKHNDIEQYISIHGNNIEPEQIIETTKMNTETRKKEPSRRYINPFFLGKLWLSECPKDFRARATFKAADAYKTSLTLWRKGLIRSFEMKFSTKRRELDRGYCFGIEKKVKFEDTGLKKRDGKLIITGIDGDIRFFEKPPINKEPVAGCELSKDSCGDYYLHVPIFRKKKERKGDNFVAIDPGGVVPWAFYASKGESGCLGTEMNERMSNVSKKISTIDKKLSGQPKGDKNSNDVIERRKLFRKKKRIRDHEHYRVINFLTDRYDGIILPKLKTKNISKALKSKANHDMFDISHYTFLRRVGERCIESDTILEHPGEQWTSKTCGRCGKSNLPGRERRGTFREYKCLYCGLHAHRDVHAARNIFMKWYIELKK